MMPWTRPDPHPEFKGDAEDLLGKLRKELAERKGPPLTEDFRNRGIWSGSWARRGQTPGLHKTTLVGPEHWFAKCAYCEMLRDSSRELDVEHYRPKAAVTEWSGDPPIISDTPPPQVDVGPGYWWLAFTWTNYALACKPCNQEWKRNLFPVGAPRPPLAEGVEAIEQPLLLDPAASFHPRAHFRWTIDGFVEPVSPEGRATIITCGLNRTELLVRRGKVAQDLKRACDRYVDAWRKGEARRQAEAFEEWSALGSRSSEFTSMVRWFVEDWIHVPWDAIEGVPL